MYLALWIAAVSFLRFLPFCTAWPVAATAEASAQPDACSTPSPGTMVASCWTSLNVDNFFGTWTENTIMANPPMIGTLYCRPADSLTAKPTSAEYWYGAQAISAVFTYIKNISSALLSATGKPGVLETAYAAAFAGTDFSDSPVDATLFYLLSIRGRSDQDNAFAAYMKASPYAGNFAGPTDAKPDDVVIYRGMTAMLESRLDELMSGWEAFRQVTTEGQAWMEKVQEVEEFVQKWTVEGVGQAVGRLTGEAGLTSTE
ncbi:MAG: hypothetical protein LQ344_003743 [Seirophora lacunosa]|nr:MAG: hypothetical protein LQ344_003743 [Seirophora lacunosa]